MMFDVYSPMQQGRELRLQADDQSQDAVTIMSALNRAEERKS
jgi:hypothetical protein